MPTVQTKLAGTALAEELKIADAGGNIFAHLTTAGLFHHFTANGASLKIESASELVSGLLGTSVDTTANLLPANAIILAVVTRVTTAITGATSFAVGDASATARFATGLGIGLGATGVGTRQWNGSVAADIDGPRQTAAAKVRLTAGGAPFILGAVRVTVFYIQFTAPTS
jgi:hypothetical protein